MSRARAGGGRAARRGGRQSARAHGAHGRARARAAHARVPLGARAHIPSATCPLNSPVSYVWQPTTIRSVNAPRPSPKCTWSVYTAPRICEPSVYETA